MTPHYFSRKQSYHGVSRIVTFAYKGVKLSLYTSPGVFSPGKVDEGTRLLIMNVGSYVPVEGEVLDLGTGYGVIGIYLAKLNPRLTVYMTDVNPLALRLAALNAKENSVENNTRIMYSDCYEALRDKTFRAVYTNPPLSSGFSLVKRIVDETYHHLESHGYLLMVLSRDWDRIKKHGEETYGSAEILARKKGYRVILFRKNKPDHV